MKSLGDKEMRLATSWMIVGAMIVSVVVFATQLFAL